MVASSSIYCMATVWTRDHHWVPKFRPKNNTIPADVFSPVCMWNVAQHHVVSGLLWIICGTPNKSNQLGTKSRTILPFAANQWNEKSFAVPHQTLYYIQKSYKSHFCRWYWSYTPISLGQIPVWFVKPRCWNHQPHETPFFFVGMPGPCSHGYISLAAGYLKPLGFYTSPILLVPPSFTNNIQINTVNL